MNPPRHAGRTSADRPSAAGAGPAGAFLERRGAAVVLALAVLHAGVFSALALAKLRHYLYTDFDLAIFAHAGFQAARGSLYESIGGMPWLAGHVAPILFPLVPLLALFRSPGTLLVVQSVALAAGAWPVYRLARREVGGGFAPVACAALYLLYPALGYTDLFEFHPEALATPALLAALAALRAGRTRALGLWAALALLAREDVALVVLALALYAAFLPRPRRWAQPAVLGALAAVSLALSFGVIMPAFGSGATDYAQMYARWGRSIHGVLAAVAADPLRALAELAGTPGDAFDTGLKRLYHLQMLLPLGFLPLAAPGLLLVPLPVLLEHFLSARPSQHTIVFHYTSLVTPFAVAAAVVGLGNAARWWGRRRRGRGPSAAPALAGLALAGSLLSGVLFGPLVGLGKLQGMSPPEPLRPDAEARALEPYRDRMVARVPRAGAVVAGFEFLARFADREGLHSIHHFLGGRYTFSTRPYEVPRGVTAVIADLGEGSLFKHVDRGTRGRWRELLGANGLAPADGADDLLIFLRAPRETLDLVTPAAPAAPRPRPVVYDGQVAFTAGEVAPAPVAPGGTVALRTYWRRVAPADRFYLVEMLVVDSQGRPVRQLWRYLGYTLDPVQDWPAGVDMRESYRLVVPLGLPPGRYDVGVRLWWRRDGQGLCAPDDPEVRGNDGFVAVGRFAVAGRAHGARAGR